MANRNARSARPRDAAARTRMLDRLFLGGCISTYLVLLAAVVVALRAYGL
jgi:hypothetical protein